MSRIEDALRAASIAHSTPGFVAMATWRGEPLFDGAFGSCAMDGATPMSTDTVFWLASMTKALTATAAMQLVEQGRVSLDTPLAPIVPELGAAQVVDSFDSAGAPRLRAPSRAVTLRHLLTHTSGHVYDMWNADFARASASLGVPSLGTGLNAALQAPLMADPGEVWEYGIGIDWAGKVIEAVSGQTLDAYLEDHVLGPLGMTSTAFVSSPQMTARAAGMTMRAPDGSIVPFDLPMNPSPEFWGGGGGLSGTAGDYLRFLQMVLNGGALEGVRVLKAETVAEMVRNQLGDIPIRKLTTAVPFLTHDLDLAGDAAAHWGLSWQINPQQGPEGRSAGSVAWAGLANTYYWADPAEQVAGVFMTQLLPFSDPDCLAMFKTFERAVYDEVRR